MGRKQTAKTRAKISAALMGHETSIETRNKISEMNQGKVASLETRSKMSVAHQGYKTSEEVKKKISLSNHRHQMKKEKQVYPIDAFVSIATPSSIRRRIFFCALVWWYKLGKVCDDCGYEDPRALEFDHVRGEKCFSIMKGVKRLKITSQQLLDELEKCEITCRNCHQIRTTKREDAKEGSQSMYSRLRERGVL